ncbi:MAG: RnfH family protein [Magnetococcales bacterium]|nr:RnfH family protein [Magnetococcales bacterium]
MRVGVVYAEATRQVVTEFDVAEGTTAVEAVRRSGILGKFPGLDPDGGKIGIFGKVVPPEHPLNEGDRVEIYRPALGKPPKKSRDSGAEAAEQGNEEGTAAETAKPLSAKERAMAAKAKLAAKKGH